MLFSVVKREFNTRHYNLLHCLLGDSRAWTWWRVKQSIKIFARLQKYSSVLLQILTSLIAVWYVLCVRLCCRCCFCVCLFVCLFVCYFLDPSLWRRYAFSLFSYETVYNPEWQPGLKILTQAFSGYLNVNSYSFFLVVTQFCPFADWKPRKERAESESAVGRCQRKSQRSHGSG